MTRKGLDYVPSTSDETVRDKTGRNWASWFRLLDQAGASKLAHGDITAVLSDPHGLPGWWCQKVAVEYERARGLRAPHETARGFSVAVSMTVAVSVSVLYAAVADVSRRRAWFPRGAFEPTSLTKDKYVRGSWNRSARLAVGVSAKGATKATVALQVSKLAAKEDVERERTAWKRALGKLRALVKGERGDR